MGVGDGQEGDGYGQLINWEYNVENTTLGTEPNAPLAYAPELEIHHPNMSTLGANRVQLDRERKIEMLFSSL